ncbi:hypothetical protein M011DRAFT_486573 [Sporormia fimetaria CBS 119925]|uniref:Uncharacterized protein n=1 Tax=Sporormia fimetaria CBS 119925 TaxID=1340428 RepID=A0A6A6VCH9_9PLEO|nr:hypothetical protein M011DRAFT_486573 [Sporormia fimetaria CBS 119925]
MSKKTATPDAWDDDWESLADKADDNTADKVAEPVKLSKAEIKAKHAEAQRKLWKSADNPEPMLFLEAQKTLPVQPTFKQPVKLLSRKPSPQVLSRETGMAGLGLDDGDDSEEERRRKAEESFAERKARAEKERAEKQRKYAEAREKYFPSPAPSSADSRGSSPHRPTRGRGRGRSGRDAPRSSNQQSPARSASNTAGRSMPGTPNIMQHIVREPRGPQATGRGGRGFVTRGGPSGPASQ